MNRTTILFIIVAVLSAFGLTACYDDDSELNVPITVSENYVDIGSEGRYYNVKVQMNKNDFHALHITTEADWIELDADTLTRNGSLLFYVSPNTEVNSREALITLWTNNPQQATTITVHQHSEAENDANALNGDTLTHKARVGYGYNMLIDYMNPRCVTKPIFSYERLIQAEERWGTIIAEEGRAQQSFMVHSSYSLEEMSMWMQKQTTTETNILFYNKKVNKFRQISEFKKDQQTYGYSSLSKVVASRYIDEGKVQSIIRNGQDIFTDEFRDIYDKVNSQPTEENVRQLINQFGTHFVTYADLGGRLDYSVNFRSTETSRESVEKYLKFKNGKVKKDEETTETSHAIFTQGNSLAIDVYGGSDDALQQLQGSHTTSQCDMQIDPGTLGAWMNSIKASNPKSVSMVRCIVQPIWQLFTNDAARTKIINYILYLSVTEGGEVGDRIQELGLDNYYKVDITRDMTEFGTSATSTLAKIVYYRNQPKVEICQEYVPELRGDRRVTIFYPIHKQRTNIRRGIFLGDGENAPSEVSFDSKGGCYVKPLANYQSGDKLTTLYFVDGAFYPMDFGFDIPAYDMTVKDETFSIWGANNGGIINYPIVKIGPGFWTRQNLIDYMFFGQPIEPSNPYTDYYYYQDLFNGMLYTNTYYGAFLPTEFEGIFEPTTISGKHIYWYLPEENDISVLQKYIGHNCKALFANQQSGFEAQFAGFYGRYDDLNGGKAFSDNIEQLRHVGKYCFIVAKDDQESNALILAPNYTITKSKVNLMHTNWYPIRAFRSSNYKHPQL